ncbi:pilus assembly protein [Alcaligenaceae bacterium SJ-26]|nr:pilus assembly protein [Alcaligenaceae bacterium SJ-26]
MSALLDLFTLLTFLAVFAGIYALRAFSRRQRLAEQAAARLAQLQVELQPELAGRQGLAGDDEISILQDGQQAFRMASWPLVGPWLARAHANLDVLGWRENLRLRLVVMAALALIGGLLLGRRSPAPLLVGSLSALVLFVLIGLVTYRRALDRYLEALRTSLPEAIDAITRTCRAGVPLHSAFAIAAEHLRSPLSAELLQIDRWLRLGVPLRRAMIDSAQRVPIAEYRFFAVILIINQETGGRLGETMDRLSATLRARAELKMKVMSKTSEARASAKIVAALVPSVMAYMYVNAPDDFQFLLTDPVGIKVTVYAVCSVALGLLITHLMVRRVA